MGVSLCVCVCVCVCVECGSKKIIIICTVEELSSCLVQVHLNKLECHGKVNLCQ